MDYIVTARKWRPQIFEDVVGQQHITHTLKNAIKNNRLAHAYIFAGPRGVGKTTTARILAKTLNCLSPQDAEPCNNCEMCNSFNSSKSLDVIEIDGASNRRIEDIRALRESVKYAPTAGKYKVYIIDEVHMLTTESFNALLKTLEEPPEHTIFIFATTDIHKVPLTIISRCQLFDFRRIELDLIKNLLKKIADADKIEIDDESLTLIAKKADGALRDAQSLFDQVAAFCDKNIEASILKKMLNLIDEEIYFQISDAILKKDFSVAFSVTKKVYDNGWNFIDFTLGLVEHFRNILSLQITQNTNLIETSEESKNKLKDYINKYTEADLLRILNFCDNISSQIKTAQNQKLFVEISLAHLIAIEKTETISNILSLIDSNQTNSSEEIIKKKNTLIENSPVSNNSVSLHVQSSNKPSSGKPISEAHKHMEKFSWELLKEHLTKKFFTLGIINETELISSQNETILIKVTSPEDLNILNENKKNIEKISFELFKRNFVFNFVFEDNKSETTTKKISKLGQLIISELRGTKLN